MKILGWSFFLGLAFLFAAPVFATPVFAGEKPGRGLFWVLSANGILCLISTATPLTGIPLFTFLGVIAWGPGFILFLALLIQLFRQKLQIPLQNLSWST